MKKLVSIGFILVLFSGLNTETVFAQDPIFSQPYANPLYTNPAFAGTEATQQFGMNYQNNQPSNSVLYNASYDRNFIDSNNGFGILTNVEKSPFVGSYIGANHAVTTTIISLIYSHQFHIKSFTLSAGVEATYRDKNVDESKITYPYAPYQWNPWFEPPGYIQLTRTNVSYPDFAGGVLAYWKNYFAGFCVAHPTQPDESFVQGASLLRTKYIFNAGGMIHIRKVTFTPTVYFENQGTFHEQVIEGYVSYWHITAGVGCSIQEIPTPPDRDYPEAFNNVSSTMVFSLGYQCKLFRLACSYQGSSAEYSNGISEASLTFLLPYSHPNRKKVNGLNIVAF